MYPIKMIMEDENNINLFQETLEVLKEHGKSYAEDVLYVTYDDVDDDGNVNCVGITKESFENVARQYHYHCGFGGVEVPITLKVVGKDWWLERHEYDGSEWWEYKAVVERPKTFKELKKICRKECDWKFKCYF